MELDRGTRGWLDTIDGAAMLDDVLAWADINSGSHHAAGVARMADALTPRLAGLGDVTRAEGGLDRTVSARGDVVERPLGPHLVARVRPDAPLRVLLTGHLDTVYPAAHPFQACRWQGGGRLNGPGVADMKGGIAVMLTALQALERHPSAERLGYDVLLNSDEEVGSPSSAPLLAELADGVQLALTYEPALDETGTLAGDRPGSGNFHLVLRGRAAHAGRNPEDGRSAVLAAARLALALDGLRADDARVNVAAIESSGPMNMVPDQAVLRVNLRPATAAAEARLAAGLDEACRSVEAETHVSVGRHGSFGRPPRPLDDRQRPLFELVRRAGGRLGLDIAWRASGGVCDGNNLAACGLPVVDTLGVRGGAIHSDGEYLLIESLAERARLSALLLLMLAQAGPGWAAA